MTEKKYKCPTCGKELTKEEYDNITKVSAAQEKEQRTQIKQAEVNARKEGQERAEARMSPQFKAQGKAFEKLQKAYDLLIEKKTPQEQGYDLQETIAKRLQQAFPDDEIENVGQKGKTGDILQKVKSNNKEVGLILHEVKDTQVFTKAHIRQTLREKEYYKAAEGILTTTGKGRNLEGYNEERGIHILRPELLIGIVKILRDRLITIATFSLEERGVALTKSRELLSSVKFNNDVKRIINTAYASQKDLNEDRVTADRRFSEREEDNKKFLFSGLSIDEDKQRALQGLSPKELEPGKDKGLLPLPFPQLPESKGEKPTGIAPEVKPSERPAWATEIIERARRRVTGT